MPNFPSVSIAEEIDTISILFMRLTTRTLDFFIYLDIEIDFYTTYWKNNTFIDRCTFSVDNDEDNDDDDDDEEGKLKFVQPLP